MSEYIWRKLPALSGQVPDPQGVAWTPVLDFIIANRIYRIKAVNEWRLLDQSNYCTADGIPCRR